MQNGLSGKVSLRAPQREEIMMQREVAVNKCSDRMRLGGGEGQEGEAERSVCGDL
jgi:hypothetical protein